MSENNILEDEFDEAGAVGPVGAHFAPRSRLRRWAPLFAVLVLAPMAGWGLFFLLGDAGVVTNKLVPGVASASPSQTAEPAQPSATPDSSETPSATAEPTPSAEASPSPSEEAPTPAGRTAKVRVLNNTSVSGLAKKVGDKLTAAGWPTPEAGNAKGFRRGEVNRVFYGSAADREQALKVASDLGWPESSVSRDSKTADKSIVVLIQNSR